MSSEKIVRYRKANVGARKYRESAKRIKVLRESFGELQGEFAKRLRVTQAMVSAWEGAKDGPSSAFFVRFGNLASFPDNLWFWEQAGLDVEAALSASKTLSKQRRAPPIAGEIIRIPRFRETQQGREPAGSPVPLPTEFIPNPLVTICLLVDEKSTGIENSPRGLFIVDTSVEGAEKLACPWGSVVIVQFPGTAYLRKGIYIGRLLLQDEMNNPANPDGARVIGRLAPLGRGEGISEYPYLGEHLEPEGMKNVPFNDRESRILRMDQIRERARSEFQFDKGVRILGKVIGRLTGHLEVSREGEK